ncbi:hypothetical protein FVE85_6486 [Porphyridium purpureum]|uniref:Uncharacterized protein n=1 Tax=Porphyridium purpureum TaxID=35688 RepID=A0A5J4Z4V7_PORPP|nr:hypothetical protein FVE85_6486 [Porphyridium purpureum]|eukprot:POR7074..scf295_1
MLLKVNASEGFGELLHATVLDKLLSGTLDHAAHFEHVVAASKLCIQVGVNSECTCKTVLGRYDDVRNSDASTTPSPGERRLKTVLHCWTTSSGIENRSVLATPAGNSRFLNCAKVLAAQNQ